MLSECIKRFTMMLWCSLRGRILCLLLGSSVAALLDPKTASLSALHVEQQPQGNPMHRGAWRYTLHS